MSSNAPTSFAAVRDEIVSQHTRLRASLGQLDATAEGLVRSDHCASSDMVKMLEDLVHALAAHMAFEESALAAASVTSGDSSATELALSHMAGDHERQREELRRITREASSSDDALCLALAIRAFVSDVLLDMNQEEDRLDRRAAHSGAT